MKRAHCIFIPGLALVCTTWLPSTAWGQWSGTNPVWTNSNVGIGTTNPGAVLDAVSTAQSYDSNPGTAALRVRATADSAANPKFLNIGYDPTVNAGYLQPVMSGAGGSWTNLLLNSKGGNVGIGTINPQYRLSVEGAIGAREIVVTNAPWSDYVFRPGYRLRPLSEVNAYIHAHHHLPDIPSEAEVKEKGVSVGDMQAKLLAKVEELTLHMIQAEERNAQIEEQNRVLQRQHEQIRRELDNLKQFRNQERGNR
jgi:hypothetical protein